MTEKDFNMRVEALTAFESGTKEEKSRIHGEMGSAIYSWQKKFKVVSVNGQDER